ncbi:MAG: hypothetical protein Q9222_003322 [Ikaeria aurantiellina]
MNISRPATLGTAPQPHEEIRNSKSTEFGYEIKYDRRLNTIHNFFVSFAHSALDASPDPRNHSPMVDLEQWNFTDKSEYVGELHPDGTPLLYAPALGTPPSATKSDTATVNYLAMSRLFYNRLVPDYDSWDPIDILVEYNLLSRTPCTHGMACYEWGLRQQPLDQENVLDHQIRLQTLKRWWQVKIAQQYQAISQHRASQRVNGHQSL